MALTPETFKYNDNPVDIKKQQEKVSQGKQNKIMCAAFHNAKVIIEHELGLNNIHSCVILLMKSLNKTPLFGWKKKEMIITIVLMLLDDFGVPHEISVITVDF